MHNPRLEPWISREDYNDFKKLAPVDPALPDNFDQWVESAAEVMALFYKGGVPVEMIDIKPGEFAEYCKLCRINPDGVARAAFAVTYAQRKKVARGA